MQPPLEIKRLVGTRYNYFANKDDFLLRHQADLMRPFILGGVILSVVSVAYNFWRSALPPKIFLVPVMVWGTILYLLNRTIYYISLDSQYLNVQRLFYKRKYPLSKIQSFHFFENAADAAPALSSLKPMRMVQSFEVNFKCAETGNLVTLIKLPGSKKHSADVLRAWVVHFNQILSK